MERAIKMVCCKCYILELKGLILFHSETDYLCLVSCLEI